MKRSRHILRINEEIVFDIVMYSNKHYLISREYLYMSLPSSKVLVLSKKIAGSILVECMSCQFLRKRTAHLYLDS